MAKDNDALVQSLTTQSLPTPASDSDDPDSPSEEDVAAFDTVFAKFDPNGIGVVSMRDFLAIIDELDALRGEKTKPLLTEQQREQSLAFSSAEGGTAEMARDQLFDFIKEISGNKIIIASPKKKPVVRKEELTPTKSEAARKGLLPGISARSQVRPPHRKRRGDLEKMADNTTNIIADDENFSAVRPKSNVIDNRFLLHHTFRQQYHPLIYPDEPGVHLLLLPLPCRFQGLLLPPESSMKGMA